jgi:hypothetical protein
VTGSTRARRGFRSSSGDGISTWRLARLFVGLRWRLLRNIFRRRRARGSGPGLALPLAMGLVTSVAYVGLFSQSFGAIVAVSDLAGQRAALALIVGAIAFGALAAKAASGDAVLAGSPENEFLLTRPTSLPSLVVARSLAEAVTDPFGALFLFPVLVAAALTWGLGPSAWVVAALTSMIAQIGIAALAQTAQIAVIRYARPRHRRLVWMALRLTASLTLAALWMTGTWILRAPRALADALASDPWRALIARTPGAALVWPLIDVRQNAPAGALLALALLALAATGALALAFVVARRAGMHGWEEAGAPWAEANPQVARATGRPLTAGTKDFRLIVRDRSQLLALLAAPVIFVGVQVFGAAGWDWTTANLTRVAVLAFSLCLYMATIGPLAHMQAERRSFWILRTVPVSMGRLMFAKARTWALALGGLAAAAFLSLSAGVAGASLGGRLALGAWVAVGAAGLAFIAVALACQSADLSDEQRPAIGPTTVYLFLLLGGLYNLLLTDQSPARWRWLALYAFAGWSLWSSGMKQAEDCLDPEAHRRRAVRLGDVAVLVLLTALTNRAIDRVVALAGDPGRRVAEIAALGVPALLGAAAAIYLWRRRAPTARLALVPATGAALIAGAGLGVLLGRCGYGPPPAIQLMTIPLLLGQELIFRGCLQRALQEHAGARPHSHWLARAGAAGVTVTLAALVVGGHGDALGPVLITQAGASLIWAASGRTSSSFLARAASVATLALWSGG